ncbi:hypothetical protein [Spirosoma koreense]
MKTSKLIGFLTALMLLVSVSSCTTYYTNRRPAYGRHYGYRRPVPPPPAPRPYGGYGRHGW